METVFLRFQERRWSWFDNEHPKRLLEEVSFTASEKSGSAFATRICALMSPAFTASTFSARSFALSDSACPSAASCSGPTPRGRVPLIGRVSTMP